MSDRTAAERGGAVAVPADRRLRVPLRLPHRRADRRPTARSTGCACRAFDSPSLVRQPARSRGPARSGSARTGSTCRPTAVRARHQRHGDDLADADRLGARPRRRSPSGRARHEDRVTPHTRPPTDDGRRPHAGAGGRVRRGRGRGRTGVRAGVRLRPRAGDVELCDDGECTSPTPPGAGQTFRLGHRSWRSASRATGCGRGTCCGRATGPSARCPGPRSWTSPDGCRRRRGPDRCDRGLLAAVARPRPHPRPSLPRSDPAVGADDQGAHLHADRRDRGRAHHLAARDTGRRAQLGLPLHVDARLHLHAAGAALPQPRLGGRRVHAVRGRPRAERGRRPADHVRHRRPSAT